VAQSLTPAAGGPWDGRPLGYDQGGSESYSGRLPQETARDCGSRLAMAVLHNPYASAPLHADLLRADGVRQTALALAGTVLNRELPAIPVRIVKPQAHMRRARRCRADLVAGIFQFYAVFLQHLERFV
jgi:hypothetical protein